MPAYLERKVAAQQVAPVLIDLHGRNCARIAVIVAHPDDETIGAGGFLGHARNALVVHVTDGSPLNLGDALAAGCQSQAEYAATRRREAATALAEIGIGESAIVRMRFTDQRVTCTASISQITCRKPLCRYWLHCTCH